MHISVHPLTPERWLDLEAIFTAKGCSVAKGCWCMYYRRSGEQVAALPGQSRPERNRRDLMRLAAGDPPPGLIGYSDDRPVAWISLGPREDYAKLARSPVMRPVDGQAVWSVVCFVVPSRYRKRGVAKALLAGAIEYARSRGVRLLEAYPVDEELAPMAESLWFGTKTMYDDAGFTEVARRKPARPVVRLKLAE